MNLCFIFLGEVYYILRTTEVGLAKAKSLADDGTEVGDRHHS